MIATEKTFLSHHGTQTPTSFTVAATMKVSPDVTQTSAETEKLADTARVPTVSQTQENVWRTTNFVDTVAVGTQVTLIEQDEDEVLPTVAEDLADELASKSARNSRWLVPTSSPVISRFDKHGEYEGNATLRFGSPKGENIVAVESGVVTFAGSVAGKKYITIIHSDGLRSTYSAVEPLVSKGDNIAAGQKIGFASGELGLTARDSKNRYLDPELFLVEQ